MRHIEGFRKIDPADAERLAPETLRTNGFEPHDVIVWSDGKGNLLFQNGSEEYVAISPKDQ